MTNLRQRLRKLETGLILVNGLVPDSEAWFAYWEGILERLIAGENPSFPGRFPLAVVDRLIEQADRADGLLQ
jgi:hypothetical protein